MHNNARFGVDYWAFWESSLSTLNLCDDLCDILHYDDIWFWKLYHKVAESGSHVLLIKVIHPSSLSSPLDVTANLCLSKCIASITCFQSTHDNVCLEYWGTSIFIIQAVYRVHNMSSSDQSDSFQCPQVGWKQTTKKATACWSSCLLCSNDTFLAIQLPVYIIWGGAFKVFGIKRMWKVFVWLLVSVIMMRHRCSVMLRGKKSRTQKWMRFIILGSLQSDFTAGMCLSA